MTNTSPARASSDRPAKTGAVGRQAALALLASSLLLAGCVNDTASYRSEAEGELSVVLARRQDWFWQDSGRLVVTVSRLPQCQGGLEIKGVPLSTDYLLYAAPPEYPEPLLILEIEDRHFAIGTESCRVQEFDETPPDLGRRLGVFAEKDGRLRFQPGGG